MVTVVLQLAVAAALGVFSVLALLISRRHRAVPEPYRTGWRVTAIVFLPYTVIQLTQNVFAAAAFAVGAGHPLYRTYLWLAPLANHSRTFVAFALYGALFFAARRGTLTARQLRGVGWAVLGSMLLGVAVGVGEGPLLALRHFVTTALIDMVAFVVFGVLMVYLIVRNTIDRPLWFSITLHGITSVFGVLYLTGLTLFGYGAPSPIWQLHAIRLAGNSGLALLALHRYRMALRGRPVGGLVPEGRVSGSLA